MKRQLYTGSSIFSDVIEVVETFGNRKLLVNGITQSGRYPQLLFRSGVKRLYTWHQGPMRRILVFGIGGGDVFRLLRTFYSKAHITGVDIDAEILHVAKTYFDIGNISRTTYRIADAKSFVKNSTLNGRYDCVVVDLYIGNTVPDFVGSRRFLVNISRLLRPGGSVMFNYFSYSHQKEVKQDLLILLRSLFSEVDMQSNHKNIFYYCRT